MSINQNNMDEPLSSKTILCVIDEESTNPHVYRRLVSTQLSSLRDMGAELVLLHVDGRAELLPAEYRSLDAELLVETPIEGESANERSRTLAQRAVKHGKDSRYDIVIGFGWTLSRGVSGGQGLSNKFWSFVDDPTESIDRSVWTNESLVDALYRGSRKVFVFSDERRSILENTSNAANGRTYLPALHAYLDTSALKKKTYELGAATRVILPGLTQPAHYIHLLSELSELAKSGRSSYEFLFDGAEETWAELQNAPNTAVAAAIPGLKILRGYERVDGELTLGLVPNTAGEEWLSSFLICEYLRHGVVPISLDRFLSLDHGNPAETISVADELSHLTIDVERLEDANRVIAAANLDTVGGRSVDGNQTAPRKVVMAGADFKFAGDLVELLNESPDFDLKIDLWANNSHPDPTQSTPFAEWADIVICEFSSFNAIWYSQNKRRNQKLIVRLHGYELLQPWIDQLAIDNVDQIVFVSEFYRRKAIETKGWDEAKTSVISNTIDFGDLLRHKLPGAEFHLGMAGYVPILKRPDRALDLLEELLKHDDRFVLHMRGHEPWNYQWEWKKPAHQAAYRDFYSRIATDENLRTHISFESFGPDMAGWFRKIGWMLSPSYRETFHLAPVEGMASGALPIVWERDGADEIFPADYVVSDVTEAAQLILSTVEDRGAYEKRASEIQSFAARYSRSTVKSEWIELIHSTADLEVGTRGTSALAHSSLEALIERHESNSSATSLLNAVSEAWRIRDYSTAISLLDANIKLTANDTGELKQWEHWVRGTFQTAMNLESVLLKHVDGCVYHPRNDRAVVVSSEQAGAVIFKSAVEGLDTKSIGIKLPVPGIELSHDTDLSNASAVSKDYLVKYDGTMRSNYYLVQAASEIASIFRDTSARVAVANGGFFESLATLVAARRVGIPFIWAPSASTDAAEFFSVFDEIRNDDPVHEIYQAILENTDAILNSQDHNVVLASLKHKIPVFDSISVENLESVIAQKGIRPQGTQNKLSIAYAGDGTSVDTLSIVAHVEVCTSDNVLQVLDTAPDVFVLEFASGNAAPPAYEKSANFADTTNLKQIQKSILHSRVMGARSVFISHNDPEELGLGKEIARKCDVVVSNDRKSLISYMRLNPNSNQMAANISGGRRTAIIPSIPSRNIKPITPCHGGSLYPASLEDGLVAGQPVVPAWTSGLSWVDSSQIGDHDSVLRYEATGKQEDGLASLWANCVELSQGRSGLDFAVSVLRTAGFPVIHPRGETSKLFGQRLTVNADTTTQFKPEIVVKDSVILDDGLKRDLVALYRVSDAQRIVVETGADSAQSITISSANGHENVVSRVRRTNQKSLKSASLSEFSDSGVSIVVATYKGAARLPRLLSTILKQRLPFSLLELVVVPNGPDDGTQDLLRAWSGEHPDISLKILPIEEAGVAKARNLGIANASRQYITFVDDDDYLEPNYLLSLYSRADNNTVVLGRLSDVDEETNEIVRDTATNRRVTELSGRLLPLAQRAGALGMNGAKLLPTWLTRECTYDSSLRSGEDVAFMAQLLRKPGIFVTSSADVGEADYMRVMRFNSISRRDETFEFMVLERLDVLALLHRTWEQSEYKGGKGAIQYLATGQLGFMKRFVLESRSIADYERTLHAIEERKMDSLAILQPLLANLRSAISDPMSLNDGKRISLARE